MTYEEVKARLTKCEVKLRQLQDKNSPARNSKNYNTAVEKLTLLKESLQKQLKEAEQGMVRTDDATEAEKLAKKGINVDLKTEQDGVQFSKEETAAIAKEVGKAVAKALHNLGDEVAHMKAKDLEPNSFEIYVQYKNDSDDQFSFYITDDTLHLVDFSFDKEIGDVGVKPSGEAIVHVDVLANELVKHFKSLANEGMSDQEYADAKEADRLEKHPEKDTIKKIQALIAAQQKSEATKEEEEEYHEKLDALTHKTFGKREEELEEAPEGMYIDDEEWEKEMGRSPEDTEKAIEKEKAKLEEAPEGMYYIRVAVRDARKALAIIDDQPALKGQVEISGSDTYYLSDEELAYDLLQDFSAQGIEVTDENIESWDESDPRDGAPSQADSYMDEESISTHDPHLAQAILDLIDSHAATAGLTDEEAKEEIIDFLRKQKVDEDAKERVARAASAAKALSTKVAFGKFDTEHGEIDKNKPNLRKYIARPGSLEEDDIDVGHQDDEPSMLKQQVYDIATYAAKLYKILDKYDQYDGEVDFPHWWQSKVILARDYVSAAQHYLEFEEKQPALDQLALEEGVNESHAKLKREYDELVGKMKQLAKHFKSAEGEKKAKIVAALKQHTARKRELEKLIDQSISGMGAGQEIDGSVDELFGPKVSYDEIIGGIIKRFHELKKYVSKKEPDAMDDLQQVLRAFEIFDEKMAYGAHEELEEEKATYCGACGKTHKKSQPCPK